VFHFWTVQQRSWLHHGSIRTRRGMYLKENERSIIRAFNVDMIGLKQEGQNHFFSVAVLVSARLEWPRQAILLTVFGHCQGSTGFGCGIIRKSSVARAVSVTEELIGRNPNSNGRAAFKSARTVVVLRCYSAFGSSLFIHTRPWAIVSGTSAQLSPRRGFKETGHAKIIKQQGGSAH